jgi:class 3 adenylate cyclase
LEGIALQGEIYINSELYQRVKNASDEIFKKHNITFEPLPPLLLRGKEKPVDAYRVRYS